MDALKEELKHFQSIYEEMLAHPNWENSPFLKLIHAKLSKLKQEFDIILKLEDKLLTVSAQERLPPMVADNFEQVFIYLYTTEGKKLDAWQRLIINLDKQYISRPVYRNEIEVQHAVYNAPVFYNAGYVAIWVEKKFILSQENFAKDKFGHDLLVLKDRAVDLKKIAYFWTDANQYQWIDGKLIFSQTVERIKK